MDVRVENDVQRTLGARTKHRRVREELLAEVARVPGGTRLPSVKELMSRYGVSQATVDRALRYLKDCGYVRATAGRGIFTIERRRSPDAEREGLEWVDLVYFGDRRGIEVPTFHSELIEELSAELGRRWAWLRTTALPPETTEGEFVGQLETMEPMALLLVNLRTGEIAEAVARRHLAFLLMFPNSSEALPNRILIENRTVVRHWISHLTGLGHRRIAMIHHASNEQYSRDHRQRLQFYYEELGRVGLAADPDLVVYSGFLREDGYGATRELLGRGKDFTALICGDGIASGVYDALAEAGRRVGRDVSVIGVDDCRWAEHMNPPLTTVRISRPQLAALAIQRLEHLIANPRERFDAELVGSELVVRQSTGPA